MKNYRLLVVLTFVLLTATCGGGGGSEETPQVQPVTYTYSIPAQTNDGWVTGHLVDHGFDVTIITEMMEGIRSGRFSGIDSVTIVRNNTLLLHSAYRSSVGKFDGWIGNTDPERHAMMSTSKTITSALIGIAIDQGFIASVTVPFYDLFAYGNYSNPDPRKATMTLEDALTMRLGLQWDEWALPYGTPGNDLEDLMSGSTDYAKALLDLPMADDPGATFTYNTAGTIAIGQALQNAVGVPMENFAVLNLFEPLGIQSAEWWRTPTGLPSGGSGLFLEPRDMVKFGQLFINGGVWNGQQIVSSAWSSASVDRHVALNWTWSSGYGYQWWLGGFIYKGQPVETWSTRGYGGQYIICIPSLNLVVAFTADNYDSFETLPLTLVQDYILPAIN